MKYKLSVLVPSIRPQNLLRLYNSIKESFSGKFEMIVISPYDLPKELEEFDNVNYIQDWGSPIRCQQIGLVNAIGEYVSWAADDGVYLSGALDIGFKLLDGKDKKTLVMGKYYEGNNDGDMPMQDNDYYNLKNHDGSRLKDMPKDVYWMLNVGIVNRQILIGVGGWDCQFEVCPMSYNDLAVRLQNYGCEFIIQDEIMYKCSHMAGTQGDHAPIHHAQIEHDQPLFRKIYEKKDSKHRHIININNWKNCPEKWRRRFGN